MSLIEQTEEEGTFRDNLSTIHKDGSRNWIYVQKPAGHYYNRRTAVSIVLLIFLFLSPFVRVGGHPFMLLNIIERKFVLFSIPFWPQDFYLVVLLVLTVLVSFVLFTAIFGRIWCGWLCPQTIFLEMLFRKIEYAIEGSAVKQKILDATAFNREKFIKKGLKHIIFFGLSFIIANTFLAYIIGSDELITIITDPISKHIGGLVTITVFSFVFYAVFARFREQACIVVCPYGRYMSSLVDDDTVAVTYDFTRGEPRKKPSKEDKLQKQGLAVQTAPRGDCIDCHQCVNVCPTGIDIRDGIQLECVNCTACIDACDTIMTKVNKPKGLIRYTSFNAVKDGIRHKVKPRIYAYGIVLLILLTTVSYLFITRPDLDILILRQPGSMFQKMGTDEYANFYIFQGINKTYKDLQIEIQLVSPKQGKITLLGSLSPITNQTTKEMRFILTLPKNELTSSQTKVRFALVSNGKILKEVESSFVGPESP
ncbi:MAG: cytochrome c oxidase accessory protein CcoG [Ignavibacteriae bacterium]|nr:cytochrome c oxidase accessory protein CcoG [Ignavibacteriota bacterium]